MDTSNGDKRDTPASVTINENVRTLSDAERIANAQQLTKEVFNRR